MLRVKAVITLVASAVLAGCAASTVESDFGNSVRHMVEMQKAHPEVSRNPDPDVVDGTDAGRVSEAVKAYRSDVSKPEEVSRDIILRVGDNR